MDYDKNVLRKLQLTQLEILKDIDKFCKENNIEYYIAYGTTLGAIRHGGFIPWDDDIDISMKRDEYNRFIKLAKEKMQDKYDILDIENTKGYIATFAKVSKKGTKFIEASDTNKYEQGIFVDVFPLDYSPDDVEKRKKLYKKSWFWARMCVLCEISNPILPHNMSGVKKVIAKAGCKTVHMCLRLFRFNKIKAYHRYLKNTTMHNEMKSEMKYIADYQAMHPEKTTVLEKDIYPLKTMQFEDYEFPVPNNVDAYLTSVYGDYMKLPPEDKRHNHVAKELVFGDEE